MKLAIVAVIAILVVASNATVQNLLKDKEVNTQFPDNFFWNATMPSPTGVLSDTIFRISRANNVFSYSMTFMNTAFGKNTTETIAYDFNRNQTYQHTTGNDMCMNSTMQVTLPINVADFINQVWNARAKVVDEREQGGHHYMTIEVNYDAQDDLFFNMDNDVLASMNGTFVGRAFNQNITTGFTEKFFSRSQMIPAACGN